MLDSLLKGRSLGSLSDEEYAQIKNTLVASKGKPALSSSKEIYPQLAPTPPTPKKQNMAKDFAISALKGVVGIPEFVTGLADIATLGGAGKALDSVGVNFGEIKKNIDDYYGFSEQQKSKQQAVDEAFKKEGVVAGAKQLITNPSTLAHVAVESIPSMIGGGLVGKMAVKGLGKIAPKLATETAASIGAGVGEGSAMAGQMAESIRQESPTGMITPTQAGLSLLSGAVGGGIGALSGKVASALGVEDIEMALARGKFINKGSGESVNLLKELPKDIGKGMLVEGSEEATQGVTETGLQNIAQGKPFSENMGQQVVTGALVGAGMGGGIQPLSRLNQAVSLKQQEQAAPPTKAEIDANRNVADAQQTVAEEKAKLQEQQMQQIRNGYPEVIEQAKVEFAKGNAPEEVVNQLKSILEDKKADPKVQQKAATALTQAEKVDRKDAIAMLNQIKSALVSNRLEPEHEQLAAWLAENHPDNEVAAKANQAIDHIAKQKKVALERQQAKEEAERNEAHKQAAVVDKAISNVHSEQKEDRNYDEKIQKVEGKIADVVTKLSETKGPGTGAKQKDLRLKRDNLKEELENLKVERAASIERTRLAELETAEKASQLPPEPTYPHTTENGLQGELNAPAPEANNQAARNWTELEPDLNEPITQPNPNISFSSTRAYEDMTDEEVNRRLLEAQNQDAPQEDWGLEQPPAKKQPKKISNKKGVTLGSGLGAIQPQWEAFAEKIAPYVKTFKEFSAKMVAKFGESVKKALLKLWGYVKNIQLGLSTKSVDEEGNPVSTHNVLLGKRAAFNKLVEEGNATLKDNVYYLHHKKDSDDIAFSTTDGFGKPYIVINMIRVKETFDAKKHMGAASKQKEEMFRQMGVTETQFFNLFDNVKDLARFIRDHELSHIKNEDLKNYPRKASGGFDLMDQKAIDIEIRATMDALTAEQKKELKKIANPKVTDNEPFTQELIDSHPMNHIFARIVSRTMIRPNGQEITFNDQQYEALKRIAGFLMGEDPHETRFLLQGYAGTGKTTLVKRAVDALEEAGRSYRVVAFTHKAANVAGKATGAESSTIHSLLGLKPVLDSSVVTEFKTDKDKDDELPFPKVIIVDEASMVGGDLLAELEMQADYNGSKIIYMGDIAQLPPPGEGDVSPVFNETNRVELTKVERTKGSNPLMKIFDTIREGITSAKDLFVHKSHTINKEGVIFTPSQKTFNTKIREIFSRPEYMEDVNYAKIIAYTNNRVSELNKVARFAVFGERALTEPFIPGEVLFAYTTLKEDQGGDEATTLLYNQSEYRFLSREDEVVDGEFGIRYTPMTVEGEDGGLQSIKVCYTPNQVKSINDALSKLQKEAERLKAMGARAKASQAWAKFHNLKNGAGFVIFGTKKGDGYEKGLDYGYAVTSHKSQGSTYQYVFIDEDNIDIRNRPFKDRFGREIETQAFVDRDRNSLKYVAFSRASKVVVSLTQKAVESPAEEIQQEKAAEAAMEEVVKQEVLEGPPLAPASQKEIPKLDKNLKSDFFSMTQEGMTQEEITAFLEMEKDLEKESDMDEDERSALRFMRSLDARMQAVKEDDEVEHFDPNDVFESPVQATSRGEDEFKKYEKTTSIPEADQAALTAHKVLAEFLKVENTSLLSDIKLVSTMEQDVFDAATRSSHSDYAKRQEMGHRAVQKFYDEQDDWVNKILKELSRNKNKAVTSLLGEFEVDPKAPFSKELSIFGMGTDENFRVNYVAHVLSNIATVYNMKDVYRHLLNKYKDEMEGNHEAKSFADVKVIPAEMFAMVGTKNVNKNNFSEDDIRDRKASVELLVYTMLDAKYEPGEIGERLNSQYLADPQADVFVLYPELARLARRDPETISSIVEQMEVVRKRNARDRQEGYRYRYYNAKGDMVDMTVDELSDTLAESRDELARLFHEGSAWQATTMHKVSDKAKQYNAAVDRIAALNQALDKMFAGDEMVTVPAGLAKGPKRVIPTPYGETRRSLTGQEKKLLAFLRKNGGKDFAKAMDEAGANDKAKDILKAMGAPEGLVLHSRPDFLGKIASLWKTKKPAQVFGEPVTYGVPHIASKHEFHVNQMKEAKRLELQFKSVDMMSTKANTRAIAAPVFIDAIDAIIANGQAYEAHDMTPSVIKARIEKLLAADKEQAAKGGELKYEQEVHDLFSRVGEMDKKFNVYQKSQGQKAEVPENKQRMLGGKKALLPSDHLLTSLLKAGHFRDTGEFHPVYNAYNYLELENNVAEAIEELREVTQLGERMEDVWPTVEYGTDNIDMFRKLPSSKLLDYAKPESREHGRHDVLTILVEDTDKNGKKRDFKKKITLEAYRLMQMADAIIDLAAQEQDPKLKASLMEQVRDIKSALLQSKHEGKFAVRLDPNEKIKRNRLVASSFMGISEMKRFHQIAMETVPTYPASKEAAVVADLEAQLAELKVAWNEDKAPEVGAQIDDINRQLKAAYGRARIPLLKKIFAQSAVMTSAKFEEIAADYNEMLHGKKLTKEEVYDTYLKMGGDVARMNARLNMLVDQALAEKIDKVVGHFEAAVTVGASIDMIQKNLKQVFFQGWSKQKQDLFEEYTSTIERAKKVVMVDGRTKAEFDAIQSALDSLGSKRWRRKEETGTGLETPKPVTEKDSEKKNARLQAKADAYALAALAFPEELADNKAARLLAVNGIVEKPVDNYTPTDIALREKFTSENIRPATIKNKIIKAFFSKIAEIFGAELVPVIANNTFDGHYIASMEGKPKIVINMNAPKLTRVFFHELFHHVLNKTNQKAYDAFKVAIKDSVDKAQWDKAINHYAEKMYDGQFTVKDIQDIVTGHYADNSRVLPKKEVFRKPEEQAVPRNYYKERSAGNFNQDPYNSFSSNQMASPEVGAVNQNTNRDARYRKISETRTSTDLGRMTPEQIDAVENEIYADMFAQAASLPAFWGRVAEIADDSGAPLSIRLITRLATKATAILSSFRGMSAAEMSNPIINGLTASWAPPKTPYSSSLNRPSIVDTLAEMVVAVHPDAQVRDKIDRAFPKEFTSKVDTDEINHDVNLDLENKSINALKVMLQFKKDKIQNPGKLSAKAIKNVQQEYDAIQEVLIRKEKETPKALFTEALSGENKMAAAKKLVKVGYAKAFPNGIRSYKDVMDAMERFADALLDFIAKYKPKGMFADYRKHPEIVNLAEKLLHAGVTERTEAYMRVVDEHKEAFKGMTPDELEEMHDKVSRNPDPAYWESMPEPRKKAFEAMEAEAEKIFAKLVEAGIVEPQQYRATHMGQSIRWMKNGVPIEDSVLSLIEDEHSKVTPNDRFVEAKSTKTTKEIKEGGLKYETIDPFELFLNYVEDTSKLIAVKNFIKEGSSKVIDDKQLIRRFSSDLDAAKLGYVKINDDAFKVIQAVYDGTIPETTDYFAVRMKKRFDVKGKKVWRMTKDDVAGFTTRAEAEEYIRSAEPNENIELSIEEKKKPYQIKVESPLYFNAELAELVNVILSKDNLRTASAFGISGNDIMLVKNTMTMAELSLSTFHAFTITQELVASYAAWMKDRYSEGLGDTSKRGIIAAFNPIQAYKESDLLVETMKKVIKDPSYADTPEGSKLLKELLGTDSKLAVEIYKQFGAHGGQLHQDRSLRGGINAYGEVRYSTGKDRSKMTTMQKLADIKEGFVDSWVETYNKQMAEHPNSKFLPMGKAAAHHILVGSTAWLMEEAIPRIKFAAFAREFSLKMDKAKASLGEAGLTEDVKAAIARDTVKFIEDRFGEVNWNNMWLNKSYKTALQFAFRSFTWFAGSWKALGKAGVDLFKMGWFRLKGEKYELTEKGIWGLTAVCAHAATVGAISLLYTIHAAGADDEQETEEDTPYLTRMLFPRIDPYDNTKRLTIPSYVSEGYKIMSHFGWNKNEVELSKLITGRFNSLIGGTVDLWKNEDFRGVLIRNPEDSYLEQAYSMIAHMIPAPMSFANMHKTYQDVGFEPGKMAMAVAGFSDAPSSAKRSPAANLAFSLGRREYKGKETTEDEMEIKDDLKRAMRKYVTGDRTELDELRQSGKVSKRQVDIAMTRYPVLDNKPNPKYKDQLSQALQRLTVDSSLKVYEVMSDIEKEKHSREIQKKINNMRLRKDTPAAKQADLIQRWKEIRASE